MRFALFTLLTACVFDPAGLGGDDVSELVVTGVLEVDAAPGLLDASVADATTPSDAPFPPPDAPPEPCNPLDGSGCPSGTSCRLDEAGGVACLTGVGFGNQYAPCSTYAQCSAGFRCNHATPQMEPGECRRVCVVGAGTCVCAGTSPPTVVNGVTYGSCSF